MRFKLLLSYDGSPYQGWQKQPESSTVQGTLETVLAQILREPVNVVASGRTDAGTHAMAQVAHFDFAGELRQPERLQRSINSLLPESIVVKGIWQAPLDFHARRSALAKTYIYRLWNHPVRSALWCNRALWVPRPIDVERINQLATVLLGRHDFKSFQSQGTVLKSTERTLLTVGFARKSAHLLEFRVRGNGFLKQMVRNMLGTLLHLERHHMEVTELIKILAARDRRQAKTTVAAHGLYLYQVEYPPALDNKCRKL